MCGAGVTAGEFGYNFNLLAVGDWTDRRIASAVAALAPGHLRIPGGTVSDYWDWDRGGLVTAPLGSLGLPGVLPYPASIVARAGATFDAVAPTFRASGAEALFTANIVTSDLDAELARIRQAMDAGLRIRRVEIGNEQYFGDPAYRHLFPTARAYADAAETWARSIKAHFPGMQVAVIGILDPAPALATNDQRVIGWNRALVESGILDVVDAVALHAYGPPPPVPPAERGTPAGAARLLDGVWEEAAAEIGDPALRGLDDDVRFWITEFNLADTATSPMVAGTWLHGLATMGQAMIYLADPRIDVVTQHVVLGEPQWQSLVGADGRAVDWSARGVVAAPPLSPTATGETGALVGRATAGGGVAHAFDPTPLDPRDPALGLRIVRPDGSSAVLIANGTAAPVAVDLAGTATILTASDGDPWSSGLGPDDPVRTVVSLGSGGRLTVPGFSATLAELPPPVTTAGPDRLTGFWGDDVLTGGPGDDVLDGGPGRDTAVFSGERAQYAITKGPAWIVVADLVPGRDGTDTLLSVEAARFADTTWKPAADETDVAVATQLFTAYLGRGVTRSWRDATAAAVADGGVTPGLLQAMYRSAIVDGAIAESDPLPTVVDRVFGQMFGVAASAFERQAWTDVVHRGAVTREALPWAMFAGYLGAADVPPSHRVPAQARLVAVDAFTGAITDAMGPVLGDPGSPGAGSARTWLAPIRSAADAAAKASTAARDVAALASAVGSGPVLVGVVNDAAATGYP